MLPVPRNYAIMPAVVRADKPTEMTVLPNEKAFLLFEGETYTVTLIAVDSDEPLPKEPRTHRRMELQAHAGVLRFSCVFPGEQEHLVILSQEGRELQRMHVFSVREDLYALRPMRGDLHSHSCRSDGKRDPSALAGHYREQGFDFFALTDHNRYYPGGEIDESYASVRTGFTRVLGEEIHTPGTNVHIVHVGGKRSVAEVYWKHREQYEREVQELAAEVPEQVPQKYRERYAMAMWATRRIHEAGGLAIFAHPYWRPGASMIYNVSDEMTLLFLRSGMFDAYELLGDMGQPGNNRSVALWGELRQEGWRLPVVSSSDVHSIEKSGTFPHQCTIVFAEDASNDAIIEAVRRGNTVAVETTGEEYAIQYRCYGSLRLVTYAQFLLQYYFPDQQRLCQGEGVAMRAYALDDCSPALIEMQAEQVERYRQRYFGQLQPLVPDDRLHDFEERWRERQLQGPHGRGSIIDPPTYPRLI